MTMILDLALLQASGAGSWPQWRGPARDGVSPGPEWPDSLGEDRLRRVWRVPLGPGYSGPLAAPDRVFVTETRDRSHEVVRALDRTDGRELWRSEWPGSLAVPFFAKANGDWIRATPAFDGKRLYVAGMRDVLACLDAGLGEVLWKRDFVAELRTPPPAFGFVSSPLVDSGSVYVQAGASLLKLDADTGTSVWRALEDGGGMGGSAFSSPVLAEVAGRRQLLVQGRERLSGVDPSTGSVLWTRSIPAFRGMNILTPLPLGDAVFTSTYQNKSWRLRISESNGTWSTEETWSSPVQAYMSSPIVHEGKAYLHLQNQRFACLDLATGTQLWISPPFGKYASLVRRGNRILALDSGGRLLLFRASPGAFELLSERKVAEAESWAHLAVAGADVLIRDLDGVSAWRWE